jgi:drug/metabolite transporter (DMT)-like permease
MFVAQMEALRLSLAANVITVKRAGTLLTVLMGGLLFRERHLGRRLAGTAILLAGVWLVATS